VLSDCAKCRGRRAALAGALLVLCLGASDAGAQVIDRVLAVVDGRLVTLSDVRASMALGLIQAAEVGAAAERWVERLLILQEVDRFAPPEPPATEIDRRVSRVLAAPDAAVQARLAALGVTEDWVRRWVRDDLRIESYIEQRFAGSLEPGPEEMENYFRQNPGELMRDGQRLGDAEAQALARERLMTSRRRTLVADWLDGLKRRAAITRPASP
jgi:hypothetical protein